MLALALAAALSAPADDWLQLFHGKDLTGWKANRLPESFQVVDGAIRVRCTDPGTAHLFYVGDKADGFERFTNFELEATVRAEPDANSGIFVHTDFKTMGPKDHRLSQGYEVQLNSSVREKAKTGSLYAIKNLPQSPVDESKWFVCRVVVAGKRITVTLDGKEVLDYTEPPDVERPKGREGRKFSPDGGAIALQGHDPKSVWYFKDIRVKRLP
jgi:hypothetical protein